jgi:phosphoribosyl 1,2-cyclic phosphodiesterase
VKVTFWGTRGSIATPGPETTRYGGDTSCVSVTGTRPSHLLVLDAGSGIRRLGTELSDEVTEIDLLLTHLHIDHIVGIGFFAPLYRPGLTLRIWGPPATTSLLDRLGRYLSPPLFPVRLRDAPAAIELHELPEGELTLGEFTVTADAVIHPDPALGFRVAANGTILAYIPDHEPALGPNFPSDPHWTSGARIAGSADLLVHDAQYTPDEYDERIGWGHSSVEHAVAFADLVGARTLALFHHDPTRDDAAVDALVPEARKKSRGVEVLAAREGDSIDLLAAT